MVLLCALVKVNAQTPMAFYSMPDSVTKYKETQSVGRIIFDKSSKKLWMILVKADTSKSIATSTKVQLNPSPFLYSWLLHGNASTDSTTYFIGTTDATPLMFGVNGSAKLKLSRQGSILSFGALYLNNVFSGQGNIGLNYTGNINGTYMYGNIGLAAATITGSNLYSNIVGGGGVIQGGSNNNSNYVNGSGIINGGGNVGNIVMSSGGISGSYSGTNIINTPYSIHGSSSYNLIFGPSAKMNRSANNTFAFNGSTGADNSYAFGLGTVTKQQHEFVCGLSNDTVHESGRLFSIGKGSNTNALTITATKTKSNTDSTQFLGRVSINTNDATNNFNLNGNASIGTTLTAAPTNGLYIQGNIYRQTLLDYGQVHYHDNINNMTLALSCISGKNNMLRFVENGSETGNIHSDGSDDNMYFNSSGSIFLNPKSTRLFRLDTSAKMQIGYTLTSPETTLDIVSKWGDLDAGLLLAADHKKDLPDKWFIKSKADSNNLEISNNTTTILSLFNSGNVDLFGNLKVPTIYGSRSSGGNITISSTAHATKGKINFGASSAFDEVNNYLGIGDNTPSYPIEVGLNGSTFGTSQGMHIYNSNSGINAYTMITLSNNTGKLGYIGLTSSANTGNLGGIGGNSMYVGTDGSYKVSIGYNSTPVVNVTSTTTVGIGTLSPTRTLDVNGEGRYRKGIQQTTTDVLPDATNDTLFSVPLATDSTANYTIPYGIECYDSDKDTLQAESGIYYLSATNENGSLIYAFTSPNALQPVSMKGTLTSTLSCVLTSSVLYVIVNYNSSLLSPTIKIRFTPLNFTTQSLTLR